MRWRAAVLGTLLLAACGSVGTVELERAVAPERPSTTTTSRPPTSTTTAVTAPAPPVTTATTTPRAAPTTVAPTTTAPPARVLSPAGSGSRAGAWTMAPYHGLGAWLDAFDWSVGFARAPEHTVGVEAVDHMAAEGVQTIYIQASRWNSPTDVLEPERLVPIIDRAHQHGMAVVAWYLPTFEDPATDLRRMLAIAELDIDGLGVDIESTVVEPVAERNRRLIELSAALDEALGDRPLAAIVLEPVIMEDVNPNYWPGYPWAELAPHYDVWLPMGYWTNRRGEWRSAHRYTATNIERIRAHIGQPDAPVHAIGGIGDKTTTQDLHEMVTAAVEHRAIGGSIYDYRTTRAEHWELLRSFRSG